MQVDRALSDSSHVKASLDDPTLAYVVYEKYDTSMEDILTLLGKILEFMHITIMRALGMKQRLNSKI